MCAPHPCRVQVCEALTTISEAVGPQFVMAELHKRAAANKNPKARGRFPAWKGAADVIHSRCMSPFKAVVGRRGVPCCAAAVICVLPAVERGVRFPAPTSLPSLPRPLPAGAR